MEEQKEKVRNAYNAWASEDSRDRGWNATLVMELWKKYQEEQEKFLTEFGYECTL